MLYRLVFPLLCCGIFLLSLSACSDPTGVGANLGEGSLEGGTPRTTNVVADSFNTVRAVSKTGFRSPPTPGQAPRSWRFLIGTVNDPLSGTITARGYLDFFGTANRDSTFSNAPLDSLDAYLRLRTTYLHGDTTDALDFKLYDLTKDAAMDGAPADTSFDEESNPIKSYTESSPTDSLLTFELPERWIKEHQAVLQDSSEFSSMGTFHGFKLSPTSTTGNLVAGFDHISATLRVTTPKDTVDFRALKSFTAIERSGTGNVPKDRTLIQDGVGPNLVMKWDFDDPPLDTLENTPLNRVEMTVPIDSTKMKETLPSNPNFVRTRQGVSAANNYRVVGTRAEGTPNCTRLGLPQLQDATCILPTIPRFAPGAARVQSETAFNIFDGGLRGAPPFTTYRIEIAIQQNPSSRSSTQRGLPSTLPVLVRTSNAESKTKMPHAALIYTRL